MRTARMSIITFSIICTTALTGGPAPAQPVPSPNASSAREALPTVEQLAEQLAQQKYQDVLREVARLLALRGEPAKGLDRYALYTLRGEAYLRTKAISVAAEAFKSAAKETQDPVQQATARATELLIKRSKPAGYVPRSAAKSADSETPTPRARTPGAALAIMEEADRKIAMEALFADETAVAQPKLKAARAAATLPPVIEGAKVLTDLRVLELAARGNADQTKALAGDLATHAHQLVAPELRSMSRRVEAAWTAASRERYAIDTRGRSEKLYGMHGLTSAEQGDLKGVVAACVKLAPVAKELAAVTGGTEIDADAETARKLLERATEVLQYDYPNAGRYNKTPSPR